MPFPCAEFSATQSWKCLDLQAEGSTISEVILFQEMWHNCFEKEFGIWASHKRRTGPYYIEYWSTKTSPTQTKVHSEQCPGPLMEAAQLALKALHGPRESRELLPLHHLEALEDSSRKAETCCQGNLQAYPDRWNHTKQKSSNPTLQEGNKMLLHWPNDKIWA